MPWIIKIDNCWLNPDKKEKAGIVDYAMLAKQYRYKQEALDAGTTFNIFHTYADGSRVKTIVKEVRKRKRSGNKKVLADRRTSEGKCTECENPFVPGKKKCQVHIDKNAQRWARRALKHEILGQCTHCNDPVVPGLGRCEKHRKSTNAQQVARNTTLTCIHCDAPRVQGKRQCELHIAQAARRRLDQCTSYRADKSKRGICVCCSEPAIANRLKCQRHLDAAIKLVGASQNKRYNNGICQSCFEPRVGDSRYCDEHRVAQQAYMANYQKNKKMEKNNEIA